MDKIFLRIKETFFENRENDTEFHNLNLPASKGIQDNIIDIRTKHILTGAGVLLTVSLFCHHCKVQQYWRGYGINDLSVF